MTIVLEISDVEAKALNRVFAAQTKGLPAKPDPEDTLFIEDTHLLFQVERRLLRSINLQAVSQKRSKKLLKPAKTKGRKFNPTQAREKAVEWANLQSEADFEDQNGCPGAAEKRRLKASQIEHELRLAGYGDLPALSKARK